MLKFPLGSDFMKRHENTDVTIVTDAMTMFVKQLESDRLSKNMS